MVRPWAPMHRLDDMKTYPALLALAAGATAAMIVVIAPLQAKDSFEPRDCSSIYCASITENATSPSGSLRLADDYCNTRLRAAVQLLPVSPRIPRPLRSIADQLPAKLLILGRTAAIGARPSCARFLCGA
jgi:hypothetical protein